MPKVIERLTLLMEFEDHRGDEDLSPSEYNQAFEEWLTACGYAPLYYQGGEFIGYFLEDEK